MVACKREDRLGKSFKTNTCGTVVVVEYRDALNVVVEFTTTGYRTETTFQRVLTASSRWMNMLQRCYDEEYQDKYLKGYYKGCQVCEEWHNFQNFAEWFYSQQNCFERSYEIDKDLTVIGNTIYSPSTCRLIPSEINGFITYQSSDRLLPYGVVMQKSKTNPYVARIKYKGKHRIVGYFKTEEDAYNAACSAKNNLIKELAFEYKEVLDKEIYENLMNFSMDNFINTRKQKELVNV